MTIAGVLFAKDWPILFGDMLISGPVIDRNIRYDDRTIVLPAKGFVDVLDGTELDQDAALSRKLVVVNKDLALAWAGKHSSALNVAQALRDKFQSRAPDLTTLENFLEHLSYDDMAQLALTICLRAKEGAFHTVLWGGGFDHPNHPHFIGEIPGYRRDSGLWVRRCTWKSSKRARGVHQQVPGCCRRIQLSIC